MWSQRQGNGAEAHRRARAAGRAVTMLLENNPYPQDVRVREEARSLAAAGYAVEVVAPRAPGQPASEFVDGVHVRRFRVPDAGQGMAGLLLEYAVAFVALHAGALRALWRGDAVLHLHNPPDFLFPAALAFRLAGRAVVFDHHDLGPELVEVRFGSRLLVAVARLAERLTFAAATHVVAANASHSEVARTRGGKSEQQVTIVRNGPPRSWTELVLTVRAGALSPVRLAYVGAIAAQDGVDALAEVVARLRRLEPPIDAALTVVGDGAGRRALEQAAVLHRVEDAVTITGWVSPEEVRTLVEDADLCLDPAPSTALNERSTMIKLAEYLALGKPVVAYDLLETRRTVGDAAVLVTPGDTEAFARAVAQLALDEGARARLARQARERSRSLTWEHSEAALLHAYERLVPADPGQGQPERATGAEEPAAASLGARS